MSASVTVFGGGVVLVGLLPPHPATPKVAAAPALAATPARNLRRETPRLINALKFDTILSFFPSGAGLSTLLTVSNTRLMQDRI
jgi:hypothetical protein